MGKKIALLIGVSNYENEKPLPLCVADIALMSDIIEKSGKYDDKLILRDSPKSIDAMEKIRSFFKGHQNSEIDEVFFYYTGHGTQHSDDFLFLFSDFDDSKKNTTSLANSDLDSMLKALNPALTIKVVDACHAGIKYIKEQDSKNDLERILKSSKDSFGHAYFLFSSLGNQSSTALSDYSVFTKSFADSLIGYEGRDVCYVDITKHIADDLNVKKYQTPLFIQQATNTEIFCHVSADLIKKIVDRFNTGDSKNKLNEDNELEQNEQTLEEKLIAVVDSQSKEYCTEAEAQNSFLKLIGNIESYNWNTLSKFYDVIVESKSDYSNITGMKSIAKWLSENNEPYFAKVIYDEESYEAKERVSSGIYGSLIDQITPKYETVTKYRKVPNQIKQTAKSPCCSISITFSPNNQATPWFKAFIVYIFSKSKLTLFYKYETEKEVSWNDRITLNKNEWKIVHSGLKNVDEITTNATNILKDINESIFTELGIEFYIYELKDLV